MIKKLEQQLKQVTSVEDIEILIENNGGIIFADTEKYDQTAEILFDELKRQYIEKKKNSHKKTITK